MEARVIIVSAKKSNKGNRVWAVAVTGEEQPRSFCKSAYAAMRCAFYLKATLGLNISDNCLSRLSYEIVLIKIEEEKKAKAHAEIKAWYHKKLQEQQQERARKEEEKKKLAKPRKAARPRSKKNSVSAQ